MSKVAYQPMTVLVRAELGDSPWISTSAKVLRAAATFATMIATCGAVAICSIGPKGSAGIPIFRGTKVSPVTPAAQDNGIGMLLPDTNQAGHEPIASDHSITGQISAPALITTPSPASVERPETSVSDGALLKPERLEIVRKNRERKLPTAVRKSLEKDRRQALRKRYRREMKYEAEGLKE